MAKIQLDRLQNSVIVQSTVASHSDCGSRWSAEPTYRFFNIVNIANLAPKATSLSLLKASEPFHSRGIKKLGVKWEKNVRGTRDKHGFSRMRMLRSN